MSINVGNQQDSQRRAIIAQMIALDLRAQKLAPNPQNGQKGLRNRDHRADPNSHDTMLAELAVEGYAGGFLGSQFANSWDAVEASSELYTVRTNDRYEMGVKGSLGGSFGRASTVSQAELDYESDLPKLKALEGAYAALSQKLSSLEGATWQLNAAKMQRSLGMTQTGLAF